MHQNYGFVSNKIDFYVTINFFETIILSLQKKLTNLYLKKLSIKILENMSLAFTSSMNSLGVMSREFLTLEVRDISILFEFLDNF